MAATASSSSSIATRLAINVDRFTGAGDKYDAARPHPPPLLRHLLASYAHAPRITCVVDLGCGTGTSTFFWRGYADRVVGVEPNADMLNTARAVYEATIKTQPLPPRNDDRYGAVDGKDTTFEFVQALASITGLADGCADIVTCSQSLHWMEPKSTFAEIKRILRPGGVFASFDADMAAPLIPSCYKAEVAYNSFVDYVKSNGVRLGVPAVGSTHLFPKDANLMTAGIFTWARAATTIHTDTGTAERLVTLALSQGHTSVLWRRLHHWSGDDSKISSTTSSDESASLGAAMERSVAITELAAIDARLATFRQQATDAIGSAAIEWCWNYKVRIAIK